MGGHLTTSKSIFSSTTSCEFKDIIQQDKELQAIANYYENIIMPDINLHLRTTIGEMNEFLFALNNIQHVFRVSSMTEMTKEELIKVSSIIKLNDFINQPASKELKKISEETADLLYLRMDNISDRKKSIEHWHSARTISIVFITFSMLILSIWFSFGNTTAPVAASVALCAVAAVIIILLDKYEQKLNEENKVVGLMLQGVSLQGHFNYVRNFEMKRCLSKFIREFNELTQNDLVMDVESLKVSISEIVEKSLNNVKDLKREIKQLGYNVQRFEMDFFRLIKNN